MKSSTPAKRRRLDKKVSSNLLDSTEIRKRYLEEHMLKKKTWHLSDFSKKFNTLRIGSKMVLYRLSYRLSTKFDIAFFLIFVALGQWTGEQTRNFQIPEVRKCIWDAYIKRVQNLILSFLIQFVFLRNKLRYVWSESDKDYLKEISSYESFLSLNYEVKCFSFSVTLFRFFKL